MSDKNAKPSGDPSCGIDIRTVRDVSGLEEAHGAMSDLSERLLAGFAAQFGSKDEKAWSVIREYRAYPAFKIAFEQAPVPILGGFRRVFSRIDPRHEIIHPYLAGGSIFGTSRFQHALESAAVSSHMMASVSEPEAAPSARTASKKARMAALRARRDEALANGMERWDLDRINRDVAERRGA